MNIESSNLEKGTLIFYTISFNERLLYIVWELLEKNTHIYQKKPLPFFYEKVFKNPVDDKECFLYDLTEKLKIIKKLKILLLGKDLEKHKKLMEEKGFLKDPSYYKIIAEKTIRELDFSYVVETDVEKAKIFIKTYLNNWEKNKLHSHKHNVLKSQNQLEIVIKKLLLLSKDHSELLVLRKPHKEEIEFIATLLYLEKKKYLTLVGFNYNYYWNAKLILNKKIFHQYELNKNNQLIKKRGILTTILLLYDYISSFFSR